MFVAFSAPDAGVVASATSKSASAEAVRAKLIKCASINCPLDAIGGLLSQRSLIIERVDNEGNVFVSATYAIPQAGTRDRALAFDVDVAIYPTAKVRARFDRVSPGETQWVVINYDFQAT